MITLCVGAAEVRQIVKDQTWTYGHGRLLGEPVERTARQIVPVMELLAGLA